MLNEKINLVVFMREYPVGMAGTKRIQNFLDYLILKDVIINVISFRSMNQQPQKKGSFNSVPYIQVGQNTDMKLSHIHKVLFYYFNGLYYIAKFKKKNCSNIIYNSGGISIENFIFILWARLLGYKLILAIEEDYTFFKDDIKSISKFKFWTVKKLDFLNCRWADVILTLSIYLKTKYINKKAKKVVLIPISAKINYNESKLSFNDPLKVVYAGTFADKDGIDDIVEGFRVFTSSYINALLILTGKSAQQVLYREKLRDFSNIIFTGFISDEEFYPLLRDADILCMCRTESDFANAGFPFKLGEYLATGNPVICSKVSDVGYYLSDQDAFLIDPGRPDQITAALLEIVNNPENARKKGLNGLNKCREFFSPETNGQELYELMRTL